MTDHVHGEDCWGTRHAADRHDQLAPTDVADHLATDHHVDLRSNGGSSDHANDIYSGVERLIVIAYLEVHGIEETGAHWHDRALVVHALLHELSELAVRS